MSKRKVSNKRSNKRSTKRKRTVKRTNTYKTKKSKKKKKHSRKYNKSLKKTIKGGEGLTAGLAVAGVAGAASLGAIAEIYRRRRRRKNEVDELTDIGDITTHDEQDKGKQNKGKQKSVPYLELSIPPAPPPAPPGSVNSKLGEPKSKYEDLLLNGSMDQIWTRYCPHYTKDKGYNIKKYKPDSQGGHLEHKVISIEWNPLRGERHQAGWTYVGNETYYFSHGKRDVRETGHNLPIGRERWSEVRSLGDLNPDYQVLEGLLSSDDLVNEQRRLYLTKGTILISEFSHRDMWGNDIYIECHGIIWSPIENTWRVIYGNLSDDPGLHNSSNHNIKLDDFNYIFKRYNIFGFNKLIAFKKLKEKVGFSVTKNDYLFGENRLIKIERVDWSIDKQHFNTDFFDYDYCEDSNTTTILNVEIKLNEMSKAHARDSYDSTLKPKLDYLFNLMNYKKIENKPNYGCFNTFKKTERQHLRKITTTLKITKISYDEKAGQFNYTISELKSDGNTQASEEPMLEDDLEAYITKNKYTEQHQP